MFDFLFFIIINFVLVSTSFYKTQTNFDSFVHDSTICYGSDELFSKKYNFKYSNNFISQLKYLVVNAYIQNQQLEKSDSFYRNINSYITNYKFFFFLQLFLAFTEVILLIYIIFLKLVKHRRSNISVVQDS